MSDQKHLGNAARGKGRVVDALEQLLHGPPEGRLDLGAAGAPAVRRRAVVQRSQHPAQLLLRNPIDLIFQQMQLTSQSLHCNHQISIRLHFMVAILLPQPKQSLADAGAWAIQMR